MYQKERMEAILGLLRRHGYLTVKFLTEELGYSTATVNRDLNRMEQMKQVKRTYGGVELTENQGIPLLFRYAKSKPSKKRIARAAAQYVADGDVIFIDGSTTAQYMGEYLLDKKDIQVITNNLALSVYLAEHGIAVTVLGGKMAEPPFMLSGEETVENAMRYNADKCFFSTGFLTKGGVVGGSGGYALLHKAMLQNSKRSFLLMDKDKIDRVMGKNLCTLSSIDVLLSDYAFEEGIRAEFECTEFVLVEHTERS